MSSPMRHESVLCIVDNSVRGGSEFTEESTSTGKSTATQNKDCAI